MIAICEEPADKSGELFIHIYIYICFTCRGINQLSTWQETIANYASHAAGINQLSTWQETITDEVFLLPLSTQVQIESHQGMPSLGTNGQSKPLPLLYFALVDSNLCAPYSPLLWEPLHALHSSAPPLDACNDRLYLWLLQPTAQEIPLVPNPQDPVNTLERSPPTKTCPFGCWRQVRCPNWRDRRWWGCRPWRCRWWG